jgi:hypothetical protein
MKIATGKEARPPEPDTMAEVFAVAGEKQEMGGGRSNGGFAKTVLGQSRR